MSDILKVGQKAPNIEAETYGGEKIKLSQKSDFPHRQGRSHQTHLGEG